MIVARGTLIVADLGAPFGHEQGGRRPCVVVGDPAIAHQLRYEIVCVVPLTSAAPASSIYPVLDPSRDDVRVRSTALFDQLRAIDKRRVTHAVGTTSASSLKAIDRALRQYLALL